GRARAAAGGRADDAARARRGFDGRRRGNGEPAHALHGVRERRRRVALLTASARAGLAAAALAAAAAGCGDPLADAGFRGTPRTSVLLLFPDDALDHTGTRVALFWDPRGTLTSYDGLVEQQDTSVALAVGSHPFNVYELPD